MAVEVNNISGDHRLAPEMKAVEPISSQSLPQEGFNRSHVPAHFAGEVSLY
jgi:hypothetical protein